MEGDVEQITTVGLVKPTRIKAFSYLRVSGITQVDGDGFPRQRLKIQEYAERNGFEVVREFRDEGISGTMEMSERPGLEELLRSFNGIKTVFIERADRLARKLLVSETILEEFRKMGVRVIAVDSGQDLVVDDDDDPTKTMLRQFLGAIAQWEKTALVIKLRAARLRKQKATGKRCGGTEAYGEREGESSVVSRIVELKSQGLSRKEIANKLNEEGIKPRVGEKWHLTTIFRILRQQRQKLSANDIIRHNGDVVSAMLQNV